MNAALILLRILAVLIALAIITEVVLRLTGVSLGARLGGNVSDELYGVSVHDWITGALAVAELIVISLLVLLSRHTPK